MYLNSLYNTNEDTADWDKVIVYFDNDTQTTIYVHMDDSILDAIIEMCDEAGFDINEVYNYKIDIF